MKKHWLTIRNTRSGLTKMKITKSQLRRIIKEEKRKLHESDVEGFKPWASGDRDPRLEDPGDQANLPADRDQITPDQRIEKMEDEETNDAGDAYWVMVDDLVTSLRKGRSYPDGIRVNGTEDEVFIKLGAGHENGITVKVLRRGK
jgi:hypothetical protein